MFRLQENHLPADPTYPADLKALGFFINEAGQFRMIDFPEKDYIYYHTNNERHNEVRREAMQICQRNEVASRLSALGIEKLYMPQLTTSKPKDEAHVPILAPPPEILKTRKRVIVLVNDSLQDLGILAYRQLQRDRGVNGGSVVDFVKEIIKRSGGVEGDFDIFKDGAELADKEKNAPGLIVMNCGQLLYSYKYEQAMTMRSWSAMPRKSMCHEPIQIVPENHIKGNNDPEEHIKFVFDNVIHNKDFVAEDADIYVIAIENGAEKLLLDVLGADFDKYGSRITAMAVINPFVSGVQITNPHLKAFLHQRARQWKVSAYNNPRECTEVPSHYELEVEVLDSSTKDRPADSTQSDKPTNAINWLETVSPPSTISTLTNLVKRVAISIQPQKQPPTTETDDRDDMDPICPTFADAENPMGAGECVFTCPAVQQCILEFFEEVAQNPSNYRNPVFKVTVSDDWNIGGDEEQDGEGSSDQLLDMSPEHLEVDTKKAELETMKAALRVTPKGQPSLQAGREKLEKRIEKKEKEVDDLTKKILATGGLQADEGEEVRENWKPVGQGPKIPFAGVMVDSELVKGAGLEETAEEELAALES